MKKICLLTIILFCIKNSNAQSNQIAYSSGEIYNQLLQLKNTQTVLYIAAHPDDENTRLLAWLVNEKKCRAAYLSLTRGDGGQNLIGAEQGIPLGIVRTQELLAARKLDGAEQYFTRAYDFGYSKTSEETFAMWQKDSILSDMVWVIRSMQPDVIITRFPKDKRAGHGHHSASGILAHDALIAAADATKFSWQLKYLATWQCPSLLWNTFIRAGEPVPDTLLAQTIGDFVPTIGKSTSEISSLARSMHKSQAFGTALQKDQQKEYFETWVGDKKSKSILENTANKWMDVKKGLAIEAQIENTITTFQFINPTLSTKQLVAIYKSIDALPNTVQWKKSKLQKVSNLILACNGIHAEVTTTFPQLSAGDTCTLASYCVLRSSQSPIILDSITAFGNTIYKKSNGDTLNPFKGFRNNCKYTVPNNMVIREPYWLRKGIENQLFVNDGAQLNLCLPEINTAYEATLFLKIEGITLPITVPINYRLIDDKKGEVQQPLQIIPSIEIRADKTVLPFDTKNTRFLMKEKSNLEDKIISQKIDAKAREVQLSFTKNNIEYTKQMNSIQYDHIPTQTWYSHATINILEEPILYTAKRVGYIAGTGDKIIDAIKLIGYSVDILLQKDIDSATLKLYDAIVVGIRAYSELPWLQQKHAVFMQYISNGGTLIANYNSISDGEKLNIGPYPFAIGRKRVTEQNANVTMLPNASNVFIKPNKIVENDWKNWIQERSVYHVENFDSVNYTPLLSMHDKGEPDDNSAVFYCKYGKGFFVYNSLALFRQLPAGHTGAHKLLANLIEISEQ